MKFEEELRGKRISEWSRFYVDYRRLKGMIRESYEDLVIRNVIKRENDKFIEENLAGVEHLPELLVNEDGSNNPDWERQNKVLYSSPDSHEELILSPEISKPAPRQSYISVPSDDSSSDYGSDHDNNGGHGKGKSRLNTRSRGGRKPGKKNKKVSDSDSDYYSYSGEDTDNENGDGDLPRRGGHSGKYENVAGRKGNGNLSMIVEEASDNGSNDGGRFDDDVWRNKSSSTNVNNGSTSHSQGQSDSWHNDARASGDLHIDMRDGAREHHLRNDDGEGNYVQHNLRMPPPLEDVSLIDLVPGDISRIDAGDYGQHHGRRTRNGSRNNSAGPSRSASVQSLSGKALVKRRDSSFKAAIKTTVTEGSREADGTMAYKGSQHSILSVQITSKAMSIDPKLGPRAAASAKFLIAVREEFTKAQAFYNLQIATVHERLIEVVTSLAAMALSKERSENHAFRLELALRDLHSHCTKLQSFAVANKSAVRKAVKKFDKRLETSLSKPVAKDISNDKILDETVAENFSHRVRKLYSQYFSHGNIVLATETLRAERIPTPHWRVFVMVGICIGVLAMLIYEVAANRDDVATADGALVLTMVRITLGVTFLVILFSGVLGVLSRWRVNHILVMGVNEVTSLSWEGFLELGAMIIFVHLVLITAFVRTTISENRGNEVPITPYWYVIAIPVIILVGVAFPIRSVFHGNTRFYFWKVVRRIIMSPFSKVGFTEVFVADQLTSVTGFLVHAQFAICLASTDAAEDELDSAESSSCSLTSSAWIYVLSMLPSWWRMMQCIHVFVKDGRDRASIAAEIRKIEKSKKNRIEPRADNANNDDSNNGHRGVGSRSRNAMSRNDSNGNVDRELYGIDSANEGGHSGNDDESISESKEKYFFLHPHLSNALKYFSNIVTVACSLGHAASGEQGWGPWRFMWLISGIASTAYKFWWDVNMDWKLPIFNRLRHRTYIFPEEGYNFASLFDFLLRFAWMLSLIPALRGSEWWLTATAYLEILRRSMWNIFRIERDHAYNCDEGRAVQSRPLPFVSRIPMSSRKLM